MTGRIFHRIGLAGLCLVVSALARAATYQVSGLEVIGAERTSLVWLKSYLDLGLPRVMADEEVRLIQAKLLTTGVFSSVTAELTPDPEHPDARRLSIRLAEKWTTIPVVRGAYGGGTPMRVFGVYDTHSFGSLWTLGFEARKYGDAPFGGVLWARAPRWLSGHHVLGLELWRDYRVRTIYDRDDQPIGSYQTRANRVRGLYLFPVASTGRYDGALQAGLDLEVSSQWPSEFHPDPDARATTDPLPHENVKDKPSTVIRALATVVFDNVVADNIHYDGWRVSAAAGPLKRANHYLSLVESELFFFHLFEGERLNLALHSFFGATADRSLQSQYFLGGFDSIRGIPDGAIFGSHAAYLNAELRYLTGQWRYLWLQSLAFVDSGAAGSKWHELALDETRASAGIGLRIGVPQIYRLMVRIDYAWSLDRPGTQGISAGLNHFFQPYRPL